MLIFHFRFVNSCRYRRMFFHNEQKWYDFRLLLWFSKTEEIYDNYIITQCTLELYTYRQWVKNGINHTCPLMILKQVYRSFCFDKIHINSILYIHSLYTWGGMIVQFSFCFRLFWFSGFTYIIPHSRQSSPSLQL